MYDGSMEGDEVRKNFWEIGDVERVFEEFLGFLRYERMFFYRYKDIGNWKRVFFSFLFLIMCIFIYVY